MKIISTYPAKIIESSGTFEATVVLYRQAVDYFIGIMLKHWDNQYASLTSVNFVVRETELLCWPMAKRPLTKYDFGKSFYKFRKANPQGKEPGLPKAGRTFPAMYREVMFKNTTDR